MPTGSNNRPKQALGGQQGLELSSHGFEERERGGRVFSKSAAQQGGSEQKKRFGGVRTMWHAESYEPKTAGPGIGAWLCLYQRDLERKEPDLGLGGGECLGWGP